MASVVIAADYIKYSQVQNIHYENLYSVIVKCLPFIRHFVLTVLKPESEAMSWAILVPQTMKQRLRFSDVATTAQETQERTESEPEFCFGFYFKAQLHDC